MSCTIKDEELSHNDKGQRGSSKGMKERIYVIYETGKIFWLLENWDSKMEGNKIGNIYCLDCQDPGM